MPKVTLVTPAGEAKFPHLNVPSTKFNPEGVYQVTLLLEGEEAEKMKEIVDEYMEKSYAETVEKLENSKDAKQQRKAKNVKRADPPYCEEVDSSGNETGMTEFRFKTTASGTSKEGRKWTFTLPLFDAKRKPFKANVGGGSIIKIAYEPFLFYTELVGAGVSMRLNAVQVLDLKEWGNRTAEGYGFNEEDGYEAEETAAEAEGEEGMSVRDGEGDF